MDNLLVPVAVSASHMGFGTLRMEPCWMALGEAAGVAAHLMIECDLPARLIPIAGMQQDLIRHGAMIIFFRDLAPGDPAYLAAQLLGVRGALGDWVADLDVPVDAGTAACWARLLGVEIEIPPGWSRRQVLETLSRELSGRASPRREPTLLSR